MSKTLKSITSAAVLTLGLSIGTAQALPFINGSISASDGFESFAAGSAIVSTLTTLDVQAAASTFGSCDGDFALLCPGASDLASFDFGMDPAVPGTIIYTIGGFTFKIATTSDIDRTGFACAGGLCTDQLAFDMVGTVSGAGFEDTAFAGTWTGNGSCNSGDNISCTGGKTGSWSVSLTALGVADAPEPASLALIGLGFAALGIARRRKQS